MTRLADSGWDVEISKALAIDGSTVRVISPFIKRSEAERLLEAGSPATLEIITRYDLAAFARGVSDTSALQTLIAAARPPARPRVRGVRAVHAKVYLFGAGGTIVTSANLTESGLRSNHEFGLVSTEADINTVALSYSRNCGSERARISVRKSLTNGTSGSPSHGVAAAAPQRLMRSRSRN